MSTSHVAEWMLVLVCAPGKEPETAGVLLLNSVSNQLSFRLKTALDQTDETILEVWQFLAADLDRKARESGGAAVLDWLESMASHVFQVSSRYRLEVDDFSEGLKQLYIEHVEKAAASFKIADVS